MRINKGKIEAWQEERRCRNQRRQQEQVKRDQVHHYFLGPGQVWRQNGFSFVLVGLMMLSFGGVAMSGEAPDWIQNYAKPYLLWVAFAAGILSLVKGAYDIYQDRKKKQQPLSDHVFDEILATELTLIEHRSREYLSQEIPEFHHKGELPMVLVKGPREDLIRIKLPLLWKRGADGILRYSDLSIIALAFSEDILYIYTCACNLRDGSIENEHTYVCPFALIKYAALERRVYERRDRRNRPVIRSVEIFTINAENQNRQDLTIPVKDYQMMTQLAGDMEIPEAKEGVRRVMEKVNYLMLEELKKKYNLVLP